MEEAIYFGQTTPEQDDRLLKEIEKVTSKWCERCNGTGYHSVWSEYWRCISCHGTGLKRES